MSAVVVSNGGGGDGIALADVGPLLHPGFVSGQWYGVNGIGNNSQLLVTANRLYAAPFRAPHAFTVAQIALAVDTAAGSASHEGRLGLYGTTSGRPGSLIVDWGVMTALNVSAAAVTKNVADVAVPAGFYWLASVYNANGGAGVQPRVSACAANVAGDMNWLLGAASPLAWRAAAQSLTGYYNDQAIASWAAYTLPSAFPAVTLLTNTACPNFMLQAA